jgi:type II restriction enzyme
VKHLFTLQQGISRQQLEEMYAQNIVLVVPKKHLSSFPKEFQEKILDLKKFSDHLRFQQKMPKDE